MLVSRSTQLLCTKARFSFLTAKRHASRLVYKEYGVPSEVIEMEHFELQKPTKDEVLLKMLASPIHPADINTIQGVYAIKPPLPAVGGGEGIGEVLEVGPDVKHLNVGDWVFPGGNMSGTWTTHYTDCENNLVKVRKDISVFSAATLRINPGTAYRMLKDFVTLQKGDVVIQNGANSAVGQAVIEIAKTFGVVTVNIVRDRPNITELKEELTNLGADIVWTEEELRKTTDFREKKLAKAKLALNCVGGKSSTEILQTLAPGGCHVTYGGMSMKPVTVPTSSLIFKDVSVRGFWFSRWVNENRENVERDTMYQHLAQMAFEEKLSPPKSVVCHFDDFKNVLNACTKGFKAGKYIFEF